MDPPQSKPKPPTFPQLEHLDPSTPHTFARPVKCINEGPDVARFLASKAYRDLVTFLHQLNRALCPRVVPSRQSSSQESPSAKTFPLGPESTTGYPPSVLRLQELLAKLDAMMEEAPPDPGPRRFGNVSFKKWHMLVEERVDGWLQECLPAEAVPCVGPLSAAADQVAAGPWEELKAYLMGGFGSAQRLDFGTGHELSFFAFLGCLWKLGAFKDAPSKEEPGHAERAIVLGVIEPYLHLVRRLILTYTLEPAGSHGVWGLDDHSFLPYIFGSAQLTRPIHENEPMPLQGSVPGAPKPSDVVKASSVDMYRRSNMYFSAIGFINHVKKGPFWEHSPILFDISGITDGWGKINKGMIKMFQAEVLAKFPVVQHFPFGSLFSWLRDPEAAAPSDTVHMANQPLASATTATAAPMTKQQPPSSFAPGQPGTARQQDSLTKAPWAT